METTLPKELILDHAGQDAIHAVISRAMHFDAETSKNFGLNDLLGSVIRQWRPRVADPVSDLVEKTISLSEHDIRDQWECKTALNTIIQGKFRGALSDFKDTSGRPF